MKKILITIISILAIVSLSACSTSTSNKKEEVKKLEPTFEIVAVKDEQVNSVGMKASENATFKTLTIDAKNIDKSFTYKMVELPAWKGTDFGYYDGNVGDIEKDGKFDVVLHVQKGFTLNNINLQYWLKGEKTKQNTKQVQVINKTS